MPRDTEIRIQEAVIRGLEISKPMVCHTPHIAEELFAERVLDALSDRLLRRDGGAWPARTRPMEGPDETVQEDRETGMKWLSFVEIYCETHESRHPGEHSKNVRRVLERFTEVRSLQEKLVAEVEPLDLELYVSARRETIYRGKPLSERTINNEINILNTALAKAGPRGTSKRERKNFGYIETPPGIDTLPEPRRNPIQLSEEQRQAFLKALFEKSPAPRPEVCDRRQFWLALFLLESVAPFRRASLIRIPRPENLMSRLTLTLPATRGMNKTLDERTFAVPECVAEVLDRLPTEPGERLLPWKKINGKPYTENYLSDVIREAQRRAGIDDSSRVLLKHLRSTVATLACTEYGEAVGRQLLGHAPGTNTISTNYTARGTSEADRRAAEELGRRALEIAEVPPDLKVVSDREESA